MKILEQKVNVSSGPLSRGTCIFTGGGEKEEKQPAVGAKEEGRELVWPTFCNWTSNS